jgi:Ca-activated chloride channel family protein
VVAVLVAGASAVEVDAQDRQKQPPVFGADVDVVKLTVTVHDAKGRSVTDLRAEDFVIHENGRAQALQLFARAAAAEDEGGRQDLLALDLGMLMDTSESMLKVLKLSQEAAVRFLEAIPRARDLLVIFFDQDIQVSRYDSEHQQGLFDRILGLKGGGNTALYDAITVYLSRSTDGSGRKVLVLFTDGEDSISEVTLSDVMQLVRSSNVTIYPIAFGGARHTAAAMSAKGFLIGLAEASGGQVFSPTGSKDLPGIYQKILDELSSQYVLGFTSDDARRDGKFRKVKVEVKPHGLRVRHRPGYYAPSDAPAR